MNTPLLAFSSVSIAATPGDELSLRDLSLGINPGELVLVEVDTRLSPGVIADLAMGLVEPESGSVLFDNQPWFARSAVEVAAARSRIGRVFAEPGWISNLDVDENVTLASRYHGLLADAEAYDQADALARRLGMPGLPAGRPAHVAARDLRRAEWVRALLGPKKLIVLEDPTRDLPVLWHEALRAEVERVRQAGAAVMWVQGAGEADLSKRLKPTLQFSVETGNITRT